MIAIRDRNWTYLFDNEHPDHAKAASDQEGQMETGQNLRAQFVSGLEGNRHAYNHALSAIARLLRPFVRRRTFHASIDPEDTLQEILISVHTKSHTYDRARPLEPWLFAIANHRVIDALRQTTRRGRHYPVELLDTQEHSNPSADPSAAIDLERLLATISDRQSEAIRLMRLEGFSARETARKLKLSEANVRVSVHRGVKRLRDQLMPQSA